MGKLVTIREADTPHTIALAVGLLSQTSAVLTPEIIDITQVNLTFLMQGRPLSTPRICVFG